MRSGWKQYAWLLLLAAASPAAAQSRAHAAHASHPTPARPVRSSIESDSQLTVTNASGVVQTYALPRVDWDWFATTTDSHGLLRIMQGRGGGSHDPEVEVEWDGKGPAYTFTEATVQKGMRSSWKRFEVWLPGVENRRTLPKGGDSVTMTFTHLDDGEIEGSFRGTTHLEDADASTPAFKVEGTIHLHRTGPHNEPNGGAWHDCDPIIHDKLVDEEGRWPSECEMKFDQFLRQGAARAMTPMVTGLTGSGWSLADQPELKPIEKFARHGENSPYLLSYTGQRIEYKFLLAPESALAHQIQQTRDQIQDQFKTAVQSVPPSPTSGVQIRERTLPLIRRMSGLDDLGHLDVFFTINLRDSDVQSFGKAPVMTPLPGGGSVVTVEASRNDEESGPSYPVTWVLLGAWKSAVAGASGVSAKGTLTPGAPRLSVQNILVVFAGNPQAAARAVQSIDWNALRQLMR